MSPEAPTCGVHVPSWLQEDDPAEVRDALHALSALGCHGDDMARAAEVLRARPSVGEWLVSIPGKPAQRHWHLCLYGDTPKFQTARIVYVAPAPVVEP